MSENELPVIAWLILYPVVTSITSIGSFIHRYQECRKTFKRCSGDLLVMFSARSPYLPAGSRTTPVESVCCVQTDVPRASLYLFYWRFNLRSEPNLAKRPDEAQRLVRGRNVGGHASDKGSNAYNNLGSDLRGPDAGRQHADPVIGSLQRVLVSSAGRAHSGGECPNQHRLGQLQSQLSPRDQR
jgi:hypothetical protein